MSNKPKKAALGRGLSALINSDNKDGSLNNRYERTTSEPQVGSVALVNIDKIETNPFQPRTRFDHNALEELANSIKLLGVIQPITVRKMGDKFQLISGERRFRASQLAGMNEIPAYIRLANDQAMLEMAIVENVQRENLDAIEIALSYQRLIDECELTQEQLADRVGKKRTTVTNYLRLLRLPEEIQASLIRKQISMGHARALVSTEDRRVQIEILKKIITEDLSVRQTEVLVSTGFDGSKKTSTTAAKQQTNAAVTKAIKSISSSLGTPVSCKATAKGSGKIEISFKNENELNALLETLNKL